VEVEVIQMVMVVALVQEEIVLEEFVQVWNFIMDKINWLLDQGWRRN
jgi:hypothetical protein